MDRARLLLTLYHDTAGNWTEPRLLAELVDKTGLSQARLHELADACKNAGQVIFHPDGYGNGDVALTVLGLEEAWRLEDPWYKRWFWTEWLRIAIVTAIVSSLFGLICGLLGGLLGRWLFP